MNRADLLRTLCAEHNWSEQTFEVWDRSEFHCVYCSRNLLDSLNKFKQGKLDHVLPQSDYPLLVTCTWNLVLACDTCNNLKRNWDPNTDGEPIVRVDSRSIDEDQFRKLLSRARRHVQNRRTAREQKFATEKSMILQWITDGRP